MQTEPADASGTRAIRTIRLKTNRLILRPFQEDDLPIFVEYRSDPEVARYQGWTARHTRWSKPGAFLERMKDAVPGTPGTWFQLAMERQAQPGIIGDCAVQVMSEDARQAQIGFTLSRAFQKQGYAVEAVQALLDFLFTEYKLHRVTATCDALNSASARLLERLRMRREGHYIENIWFKGAWGDEFLYAILESEWRQRQSP